MNRGSYYAETSALLHSTSSNLQDISLVAETDSDKPQRKDDTKWHGKQLQKARQSSKQST